MSYYNTTNETGENLKEYKSKALNQDCKIIAYMINQYISHGLDVTTSSRLYRFAFNESIPITSIRRSVNSLVNDGDLEYTGKKTKGMYGRDERFIKLKSKK